ncbi:hypothetical protein CYMTET_46645 [Cymbomonas tetramitiformis]|uniref:Uncharacterized protein n=1 Tax=Cymbomonas tetramitiformis TaxID=36881 RepID=A0AAE0EX34_9CHLO|nr:hypothetical protein CYMTET_46645 [Cymbomonas tetramitiformis]
MPSWPTSPEYITSRNPAGLVPIVPKPWPPVSPVRQWPEGASVGSLAGAPVSAPVGTPMSTHAASAPEQRGPHTHMLQVMATKTIASYMTENRVSEPFQLPGPAGARVRVTLNVETLPYLREAAAGMRFALIQEHGVLFSSTRVAVHVDLEHNSEFIVQPQDLEKRVYIGRFKWLDPSKGEYLKLANAFDHLKLTEIPIDFHFWSPTS